MYRYSYIMVYLGTTNVTFDTAVGGISASTDTDILGTSTKYILIQVSAPVTANVTGNTSPVLSNVVLADGLLQQVTC